MLLSYDQAQKKVSGYLKSIDNLKNFCKIHKINYYNALKIKNNSSKTHLPILISKILIIFGNDVTIENFFHVNKTKNGKNYDTEGK